MTMYGDWQRFARHIETLPDRLERAMKKTTAKLAHKLKKEWVDGIRHQTLGLLANADLTKAAKSSSTPLVDHGDLIGSIKPYKVEHGWFVGILKGAKTDSGDSLVNVANVLEYGSHGKIRPKRGKYLAIPVTRKASRAGSPLNFPDDLIFLNDSQTPGAVFVDMENEEIQYVLLKEVEIPPRPAKRITYQRFLPKMKKAYSDAIKKEVWSHV